MKRLVPYAGTERLSFAVRASASALLAYPRAPEAGRLLSEIGDAPDLNRAVVLENSCSRRRHERPLATYSAT